MQATQRGVRMTRKNRSGAARAWTASALLGIAVGLVANSAAAEAATQNDQTQFSVTAGSLSFYTAPAMPTLSSVTLNGTAQTTNTTMTNYAVQDATGNGSGWNVTVNGNSGAGKSAVFKQYCPTVGGCGADPQGYVSSGGTLAADSLTLNSTSASVVAQSGTGTTGTAPTLQCGSGCFVDNATAVKTTSAASGAGMG